MRPPVASRCGQDNAGICSRRLECRYVVRRLMAEVSSGVNEEEDVDECCS